jgi:LacI family transcriptional regulator
VPWPGRPVAKMKPIGVRELAKLANVSIGTVDRALNGRKEVSHATRQRILRLAEEHGYRPNPTARALSVGRSTLRIGVCIPAEIHYFYDQLRAGIMSEARHLDHLGIEILYNPVKNLGSNMTANIRTLLDSNVQALIVTPGNPAEVSPLVEVAERERNVRVVCVVTDVSATCRSTAISVDPHLSGMLAAELMSKFVGPPSHVAIVTGMISTEEHGRKVEGFIEMFRSECPVEPVIDVIEGHEEEDETFRKCRQLLYDKPEVSGIYVSTVNYLPVCLALEAQNAQSRVKLIATDLFAEALPYFENGTVSAAIYQNPYRQGQIAVRSIVNHFVNGRPFPSVRYLHPSVVLRSNLGLFRETTHSADTARLVATLA